MKNSEYNAMYNKYHTSLLNFVKSKINENGVAEEIVNDVFLKAFEHLSIYKVELSTLNTWLHFIAKNKIIDYLRMKKLETISVDETGKEVFQFKGTMNANDKIEGEEITTAINNAVSGLTGSQKDVAELYFFDQKKLTEIAEILDIPLNSVKVTLMRAKALLQEKLTNVYESCH